ncbi:MAG: response regulator transcription factor [Rhodospirillales bacterium]|nr:response regulator transcription factor [Rhodospirillales bacterium]
MSDFKFNVINVLLIDPDIGSRDSLKMILRNEGFRSIKVGTSVSDIHTYLEHGAFDLLITGADLPDGSACPVIKAIRHHEIGSNPFLPVIAVTGKPSTQQVRDVVDSGADDLLIKPLSMAALLNRINSLVNARKPFVVTCDYIGPDRRKSTERPTNVPLLEAPNTLAAKAKGEPVSKIEDQIQKMIMELNEQKLDRHITQFHWLADALKGEFAKQGASETFTTHLNRLEYVAQDAARRVEGTAHSHIADLCKSMIELSSRLKQKSEGPDAARTVPRDLAVVAHMASAIQAGFTTGSESAAREIMNELAL